MAIFIDTECNYIITDKLLRLYAHYKKGRYETRDKLMQIIGSLPPRYTEVTHWTHNESRGVFAKAGIYIFNNNKTENYNFVEISEAKK